MWKQVVMLFGAGVLALIMWVWVQDIAIPHQIAEAVAKDAPRGNLSDLYPRWLGARELLLNGRDPYREDVTREIQAGYYGRPIDPSRPNDPKDQQAFAYPVYVALILGPTVHLPFLWVHRIFFWFFAILITASILLWLKVLDWKLTLPAKLTWILLLLGSFPAIQGLKLQQLSVLVAGLMAGAATAMVRRHFVLAGVFLALATIKPQLVFLMIACCGIWVAGDWRHRQRLFWSFALTMAGLVIAGEILLPGWIQEFRRAMTAYYQYTGGGNSLLDVVLKPTLGRVASAVLVAVLLFFAFQMRRFSEATIQFQWCLSLALTTTLMVIPMFAPYNQLLLVPGLMMLVRSVRTLWNRNRLQRFFVLVTALSVFWPYFAGTLLVLALLVLPGARVLEAWGLPFYPVFAIPVMIYASVLAGRPTLAQPRPSVG
jgi:Glycosyltransferase family 87